MNEVLAEETILDEAGVKITNQRAIIGFKTYAMSDITSVSLGREEPSNCVAFALVVCGVAIASISMFIILSVPKSTIGWLVLLPAIVLIALGFLFVRPGRSFYFVRIGSASGEINALSSQNEAQIRKIVNALNEAIVRRG